VKGDWSRPGVAFCIAALSRRRPCGGRSGGNRRLEIVGGYGVRKDATPWGPACCITLALIPCTRNLRRDEAGKVECNAPSAFSRGPGTTARQAVSALPRLQGLPGSLALPNYLDTPNWLASNELRAERARLNKRSLSKVAHYLLKMKSR
jgi:hypothetical protein